MRARRTLKSAVPFLLIFEAGNLAGPAPQTPTPTTFFPAGRVCAVHDFGTPKTLVPAASEDAIWHQDPGLLAEGPDGRIYSTSPLGGKYGRGTIWRQDPRSGKFETLYDFPVADTTGTSPRSGLFAARRSDGTPNGTFYGTTYSGGRWGVGTVFMWNIGAVKPHVLFHFRNGRVTGLAPKECPTPLTCRYSGRQRADIAGSYPVSAPVVTSNGSIYGVTTYSNNQGFGVFYKLGGGEEGLTTICIFDPRMVADKDLAPFVCHPKVYGAWNLSLGNDGGSLYGTTTGGNGSVWSSSGGGIKVLHEFNIADGYKPVSLMQASDDFLYGTTWAGGEVNAGTVFQIGPSGFFFKTLTSLKIDPQAGYVAPGINPVARLVERLDTLNNNPATTVKSLYGSAKFGGRGGRGTIFRIGLDGTGFKVVHHFPGSWNATGRSPLGALLLHSNGAIYGTTYQGGTYDGGTLWKLTGTGLPDAPELTTPMQWSLGQVATEGFGKPLKASIMTVRINVCAYQALDAAGKALCANGDPNGIKFEAVRCRNPHYVQFISREEIEAGTMQRRSGTWGDFGYALTTDPANRVWDVDVGRSTAADAFWENVPKNPVVRGPFSLINADAPSMGPAPGHANIPGVELDIRRAVFRTYLYCNCELTRLVRWTREKLGKGPSIYTEMSLEIPTAADQQFINGLLKAQGFIPVP